MNQGTNKIPVETEDDKLFTVAEIRDTIHALKRNIAPGEDGIMSRIFQSAYNLLPKSTTAMYNACLRMACFPRTWKLIPIIKPGKETGDDISKY